MNLYNVTTIVMIDKMSISMQLDPWMIESTTSIRLEESIAVSRKRITKTRTNMLQTRIRIWGANVAGSRSMKWIYKIPCMVDLLFECSSAKAAKVEDEV